MAVTSTVPMYRTPGKSSGVVVTHSVVLAQSTETASLGPNLMRVPVSPTAKPVPVTVTVVPPAGGPVLGLTPLTVGVNLKLSFDVAGLVPSGVVTLTWTFAGIATAGE